jgi:hypothetical protein
LPNRRYSNPKIICFKIYISISVIRGHFYENSNKNAYYSFTTPDLLTNCILEYLKYRKKYGEKLNDKSPLIRDDFIIDDLLHIENPRTLALISYVMHLRNILIKTGLIIITPITSSDTLEKTKKRGVSKSWPPQVHAYTYDKC